jgi:hypothetical protein
MSYHRPLRIPVQPIVMQALIESGRLKWPQRHDSFAVSKALDQLMDDIFADREPSMTAAEAKARLRKALDKLRTKPATVMKLRDTI